MVLSVQMVQLCPHSHHWKCIGSSCEVRLWCWDNILLFYNAYCLNCPTSPSSTYSPSLPTMESFCCLCISQCPKDQLSVCRLFRLTFFHLAMYILIFLMSFLDLMAHFSLISQILFLYLNVPHLLIHLQKSIFAASKFFL